jgi:hypothetical protein
VIAAATNWEVPMSWPMILSGVVCVAMLALGFNLLLQRFGDRVCFQFHSISRAPAKS